MIDKYQAAVGKSAASSDAWLALSRSRPLVSSSAPVSGAAAAHPRRRACCCTTRFGHPHGCGGSSGRAALFSVVCSRVLIPQAQRQNHQLFARQIKTHLSKRFFNRQLIRRMLILSIVAFYIYNT